MYRDNTLIPTEAIRLLALGILAGAPRRYSDLAGEVRHFSGRIIGPSLDLVGAPLEVLKVEGLIETPATNDAAADTAGEEILTITEAGRDELRRLLSSNVRSAVSDLNKLIIALKVRFLNLLEPAEQRLQMDMMVEMSERELTRLKDLQDSHQSDGGLLSDWLAQEIAQAQDRLTWYGKVRQSLQG